jgi:serine/threonine protein kinase/tetratricopeptide (TPR) repeat protein
MQSTDQSDEDEGATRRLDTRADGVPMAAGSGLLGPGVMVGRYRVESHIGSGGMGSVYRAEQLHPVRRTVALKLLRGRLSTRQRAYFEIERQTLAQMQHPAIAQIFDAGTTADGVPWFAMEFIEGRPITEGCRGMELEECLALMARVCDAIQHAHQKGVVHRDLKPANILVTQVDGQWLPKIIDFGIATAAARAGLADTATEDERGDQGAVERVGTPDYMSPEQLQGRLAAIDTRSDVYALGVVLFELIAGERPHVGQPSQGPAAPTHATTVTAPSHLLRAAAGKTRATAGRLRGRRLRELDRVVLTAMARDRNDRYPSASALAEELRRFLRHLPLSVMPATPSYLLGRFARRHRLLLASAATVLATLVGGLVFSLHAYNQVQAQREVAQTRQKELEQVVAFQQAMLSDIDVRTMGERLLDLERTQVVRAGDPDLVAQFDQVVRKLDGPSLVRSILVDAVLKRAESTLAEQFADQPLLAADLRHEVGEVYFAIGQYDDAIDAFSAVLAQREDALGADASPTLDSRVALANALERAGRFADAQKAIDPAVARFDALAEDDPVRVALAIARAQLARSKLEYGVAREWYAKGLEATLDLHPPDHPDVLRARQQYALALHLDGDTDAARPQFEQVLALQRQRADDWEQLVSVLVNYATILSQNGEGAAALALDREAYALHREYRGADHPLTLMILNNLGMSTLDHGDDPQAALDMLVEAAEGRVRVLGPEHPQTLRSLSNQARALDRLGRLDEALPMYRKVFEARQRILGAANRDTIWVGRSLAEALVRAGRIDEAVTLVQAMRRDVAEAGGDATADGAGLDIYAAHLFTQAGRAEQGAVILRQRLEALSTGDGAASPARYDTALALYRHYRAAGDEVGAEGVRQTHLQALADRSETELAPSLRSIRRQVIEALAEPAP